MIRVQKLKTGLAIAILWCATAAFGQSSDDTNAKLLSRVDTPPSYARNEKDRSKWSQIIRAGIDQARNYFGDYGPAYVYIPGHEDHDLNTDEFHRQIVNAYCQRRSGNDPDKIDDCKDSAGAELIKKALSGRGDAYLSFVDQTRPPMAELVFINPHEFRDPYLYTRGIHEYTHVFQRAFPRTPTWMTEGAAEFFACYLGEKRGWSDVRSEMTAFMENVQRIKNPELGIEHMEDVDQVGPEIKQYYRHLAYDAGAWSVAFMIHKSTSRRVADIPKKFYPLVAEKGWEAALVDYVKLDNKGAFYQEFGAFLKQPLNEQLKILDTLRD